MKLLELHNHHVALWGPGYEAASLVRICKQRGISPIFSVFSDNPDLIDKELSDYPIVSPQELLSSKIDILVKSPGVSLYRDEIKKLQQKKVPITSITSLWHNEKPTGKIIAITGTKGKSTTSALTTHLLNALGVRAYLSGNIGTIGTPLLDLLSNEREQNPDDIFVIELSSYQIADVELTPDIILLLNLYPEHMQWHGSVEKYYSDKTRLLTLGHDNSVIIRNSLDRRSLTTNVGSGTLSFYQNSERIHVKEEYFFDGSTPLFPISSMKIIGQHNLSNVCAALTIIKSLGFSPAECEDPLTSFKGLHHRLFPVVVKNDVLFVNDSISTIPESALAAFAAFPNRPITAILGGLQRAQDWDYFAEKLSLTNVANVITLPDCGDKIKEALEKYRENSSVYIYSAQNLEEAVNISSQVTKPGGVVLLSPAAPSYSQFKNFEDRGTKFEDLVLRLNGGETHGIIDQRTFRSA